MSLGRAFGGGEVAYDTAGGHTTTSMFGYDSKKGPSTSSYLRQSATETIERGLNRIIRWAEKNACPIRYMPSRLPVSRSGPTGTGVQ